MGYSCISGSHSCALGCTGTSRAKKLGFDQHSEEMYSFHEWHSAHVALGMRCICCTRGMCSGLAVELSGLNLGSGSLRPLTGYQNRAPYVLSDSAQK